MSAWNITLWASGFIAHSVQKLSAEGPTQNEVFMNKFHFTFIMLSDAVDLQAPVYMREKCVHFLCVCFKVGYTRKSKPGLQIFDLIRQSQSTPTLTTLLQPHSKYILVFAVKYSKRPRRFNFNYRRQALFFSWQISTAVPSKQKKQTSLQRFVFHFASTSCNNLHDVNHFTAK